MGGYLILTVGNHRKAISNFFKQAQDLPRQRRLNICRDITTAKGTAS
ncbi:hypothetical protein ACFSCW_13150 [Sphingomonas tabacisoli]|uniref:Transposase n=1 Tax=Sphingomonas tabacisoli TaxID=2249466 RepID=A0ABW4I4F9_9SPHN